MRKKIIRKQRATHGSKRIKSGQKKIQKTPKDIESNGNIVRKLNGNLSKCTQEIVPIEEVKLQNGKIVVEEDKKEKKLTQNEKGVIEDLVKKYDKDFKKMFMDRKVNVFQWNKNKIKRVYFTYLDLYGEFNKK